MKVSTVMYGLFTQLDVHVRIHSPFVSVQMLVDEDIMADVFITFLVDLEPQQPDNSWVQTFESLFV